jgi:hypothetical protein
MWPTAANFGLENDLEPTGQVQLDVSEAAVLWFMAL